MSRRSKAVAAREPRGSYSGTALDVDNSLVTSKNPKEDPVLTGVLQGLSKEARLLDVGAGTGNTLAFYRALGYANLHGVEVAKKFVAFARAEWGLDITECPGEDLSCFEDKSFDVVYSHHALEHMERPDLALREMSRVLKDDGTLVIGLPNGRHLNDIIMRLVQRLYYGRSDHIQSFSYGGFCALLAASGFTVVSHSFNYESVALLLDQRLPLKRVFAGLYSVIKRVYWHMYSFDIVARRGAG